MHGKWAALSAPPAALSAAPSSSRCCCLACTAPYFKTSQSTAVPGGWRVGGRYAMLHAAAADLVCAHHALRAIHITQASVSMWFVEKVRQVCSTMLGSLR